MTILLTIFTVLILIFTVFCIVCEEQAIKIWIWMTTDPKLYEGKDDEET